MTALQLLFLLVVGGFHFHPLRQATSTADCAGVECMRAGLIHPAARALGVVPERAQIVGSTPGGRGAHLFSFFQ